MPKQKETRTLGAVKIGTYRKRHSLSRADLAKKLGVTTQSIGNYERGTKRPDWDVLITLHEQTNGYISPNDFIIDA